MFLKITWGYYLIQKKKFLITLNRFLSINDLDKIPKREPSPELATEATKSKLQQKFMNQFIAGEKDINDEKLWNYLKYHNSQFLIKNVIRAKQSKNVPLFKKKVLQIKIQKKSRYYCKNSRF